MSQTSDNEANSYLYVLSFLSLDKKPVVIQHKSENGGLKTRNESRVRLSLSFGRDTNHKKRPFGSAYGNRLNFRVEAQHTLGKKREISLPLARRSVFQSNTTEREGRLPRGPKGGYLLHRDPIPERAHIDRKETQGAHQKETLRPLYETCFAFGRFLWWYGGQQNKKRR